MTVYEEGKVAFEHYTGSMDVFVLIREGERACPYLDNERKTAFLNGWDDAVDKHRGLT